MWKLSVKMSEDQYSQSILSKFRHMNRTIRRQAFMFCRSPTDLANSVSVTCVVRRVHCTTLTCCYCTTTTTRSSDTTTSGINNLLRSIANKSPYNGNVRCSCSYVHPSLTARHLRRHEYRCMQFPPQIVKYLYPDDHTEDLVVKFRTRKKQHRLQFYLGFDF